MPGHGQFLDQISVKTYVGTPSFYCEMCPIKLGHAQFQKRDYPPVYALTSKATKGKLEKKNWIKNRSESKVSAFLKLLGKKNPSMSSVMLN